jgi:hypothetical protein
MAKKIDEVIGAYRQYLGLPTPQRWNGTGGGENG